MKNKIKNILAAALLISGTAAFTACSSDDDDNGLKSYPVKVTLNYGDELSADNVSDLKVIATNDLGEIDTLDISSGTASMVAKQGTYTISVEGKVKDEANAYVKGTLNTTIYGETTLTVPLSKIYESTLIFKAIYNAGSKMGYVKDTYYEIVNNSDEVQYLDGVILAAPQGHQKVANAWQANGITDLYPSGQGAVLAFPGTGKEHPLQPGESIIVANDAVNHAELSSSTASPDLSNADWEIYLDYNASEVDYSAPNLDVLWYNNKYMAAWGLGFFGRAFLMARLPEGMTPEDFVADSANIQTTPNTTSTMEFIVIPSKYVLDAVDVWDADETEHYPTFLAKDDAEGVLSSTAWSGKCERRKVVKVTNGRAYFKDTNKSSDDFLTNQDLTVGKTYTTVDE